VKRAALVVAVVLACGPPAPRTPYDDCMDDCRRTSSSCISPMMPQACQQVFDACAQSCETVRQQNPQ
jgi:hypothetical protein